MTNRSPIDFSISPGACIYYALLLLLLPADLIASAAAAAAVHETCHLAAIGVLRVPVLGIRLSCRGAAIHTLPLHPKQELICAAAGPAGSFLCTALFRPFPLIAFCAMLQGLWNLIPVYPLDGGRMVRSFCLCFFPRRARVICRIVTATAIGGCMICAVYLAIAAKNGLFLPLPAFFLLNGSKLENFLAKGNVIEYNNS